MSKPKTIRREGTGSLHPDWDRSAESSFLNRTMTSRDRGLVPEIHRAYRGARRAPFEIERPQPQSYGRCHGRAEHLAL